MKMIKAPKGDLLTKIKELYESAFPPSEKKPFRLIEEKTETGEMEIYAIVGDSGEFLGLAIFILHGRIALLDYFAIDDSLRGKGIGSAALSEIKVLFPEKVLLLEIEDPEEMGADNTAERVRRERFYTSRGMSVMPYKIMLFGVKMLVLTFGGEVDFSEYHNIFVEVFGDKAAKNVMLT